MLIGIGRIAAAALAVSGVAAAAQDMSRYDAMAASHGDMANRIVQQWQGRPARGAPAVRLPERLEVPDQYASSVTEAEHQLMLRRMRAITELLLAQPSLQSSDIQVSLRPYLYRLNMNRGAFLTLGLNYELRQGGEIATVSISTSPMPGMAGEWRTVGQTQGGCRREQKVRGAGSGGEVYRFGTLGPSRGTAVPAIEIEGGGAIGMSTRRDLASQAESLPGRVIAAVQTLDCARLLRAASG